MRLSVRPIRYTSRPREILAWLRAIGLAELQGEAPWWVLAAGSGRVAVHQVDPGHPHDGATTFAVETDDLDELERRWNALGIRTRRIEDADVLLFGTSPLGGEVVAGEWTPGDRSQGAPEAAGLAVAPMVVTDDVRGVGRWFTAWGWEPAVVGDRGGWAELSLPDGGGLVGIHVADNLEQPPPTSDGGTEAIAALGFEHPRLEAVLERLRAAGDERSHIIDESYGRSLRVPTPDGDVVWVNETQTDLYGYQGDLASG